MPNIKSAKKRVITSKKNAEKNASQKSALRTSVKKAVAAIEAGENAEAAVKAADISLDKAASKGLIHKNTAARKKSRLAKAMKAAEN